MAPYLKPSVEGDEERGSAGGVAGEALVPPHAVVEDELQRKLASDVPSVAEVGAEAAVVSEVARVGDPRAEGAVVAEEVGVEAGR